MLGGLTVTLPVGWAGSSTDRESGTVGLKVARVASLIDFPNGSDRGLHRLDWSWIVGSIPSEQVGFLIGPAVLEGLTRLVRRACSPPGRARKSMMKPAARAPRLGWSNSAGGQGSRADGAELQELS